LIYVILVYVRKISVDDFPFCSRGARIRGVRTPGD